ncbi:STM4015 family protein [Spirillospora sp. NPDC029432]|uniref:STM4015 family protein n=1 Tax=Spirillospora sp. NPDC029432 TaxID=3154599 RepID=UPI003453E73F
MGIYQHLTTFAGRPIADLSPDPDADPDESVELSGEDGKDGAARSPRKAYRLAGAFEGVPFDEILDAFLDGADCSAVTHLVIGYWGASYDDGAADPTALLVAAADRLPSLEALFIGDIVGEESEISWIEQSDITPLFEAFPRLAHLEVRGGTGLKLSPVKSDVLRTLRFEAGGLPGAVVRAVGDSDLPALEHLDLWLGVGDYGGDARIEDLAAILGGARLPSLKHLGLENSEIQDEIARAVAGAPIVARLESLSLAMGALTDPGAEALVAGQPLTHLKRLDLHHHYLTDATMERLRTAFPGVEVDLDEQDEAEDDWVYVAVSE